MEKTGRSQSIHAGHRQRVRERYVQEGIDSFCPHEVLELLLYYVVPQKDTNELAHRLLEHFGGRLSGVLEADVYQLCEVKGIGFNAAVLISMLLPVVRLYQKDKQKEVPELNLYSQASAFVRSQFLGINREAFLLIMMDAKGRVLAVRQLATGSQTAVSVPPRKIAEEVLRFGAVRVIIAHNHPGGNSSPSTEDIMFTASLERFLRNLEVVLEDHIIVGDDPGDTTSLKYEGYLCEEFRLTPWQDLVPYDATQ